MKKRRDVHSPPTLAESLVQLCSEVSVQSGQHIRPVNEYCATRLVLEGGFPPEWLRPSPSFAAKRANNAVYELSYSAPAADSSEHSVLGGIKYKNIDLTVVVPGVGPALGISSKSTGNAFRNLTNRMEEALGDCTNIHLMYPGFVFGFLHLIRCAKKSEVKDINDASFGNDGEPLAAIRRYHEVLVALSGRSTITDPGMKYESVGLLVYRCHGSRAQIWEKYPPKDSSVHFSKFFQRLYDLYDLRYAYPKPEGPNIRKAWRTSSDILGGPFDARSPFAWELRSAGD